MNIVLYGFSEATARQLAGRFGFGLCRSFDELGGEGNRILLQGPLATDAQRLDFFEQMSRCDDRIDAVVVPAGESFSAVHYCSRPEKFFSVSPDPEEGHALDYELSRIVETHLGLLCAHEQF